MLGAASGPLRAIWPIDGRSGSPPQQPATKRFSGVFRHRNKPFAFQGVLSVRAGSTAAFGGSMEAPPAMERPRPGTFESAVAVSLLTQRKNTCALRYSKTIR